VNKYLLIRCAVYSILLLISSCATVSKTSTTSTQTTATAPALSWQQREQKLTQIAQWQIDGKIAIRTAKDAGSLYVKWNENHRHYTILLTGPLGSPSLQLVGQPNLVVLKTNDGKHFTAKNSTALLMQQTGWNLPIENLYYWIRGLPVPGQAYHGQYDNQNRLTTLSQAGWQIQFLHYTNAANVELPDKLALSGPNAYARIAVSQWGI